MTRKYSTTSVNTTLAVGISSTATTATVTSGTASGLLGGVSLTAGNVDQFAIAIDHDTANEEIVWVTGVTTDALTIVRGRAGTSNVAHSAGASVKHVLTGEDLNYFIASIDSTVRLTDAQTIAGIKTFTSSPVISSITNTGTITLPTTTDTLVGRTTTDTLTNKSLSSPKEQVTVVSGAAGGTMTFDAATSAVQYHIFNATANWTLNIRGNSTTTLNSMLAIGESITVSMLTTQGTTAYYPTALTIDGAAPVSIKWLGGIAPTSGNVSSVDAYTYTIIKTASATFYAFVSQTKFA